MGSSKILEKIESELDFNRHSLPIVYTAEIDEKDKKWKGKARVPSSYFPPNVSKFNAFAIHGVEDERV